MVAFLISTLVVNPQRPGAVIKAVLGTGVGQSVATDAIAATLRSADPSITTAQADADARAIVASPALASSLGSSKGNVSSALLTQLRSVDPAAATAISNRIGAGTTGASPLSALPDGALTAADHAHSVLRSAELYLALIAVAAVALALLIGPRRDRVLVRVGWWAVGASVVQLLIWLALPKILGHFDNAWAQVGAAALRAGGTGLLTVFVALAVGGALAIVVGKVGRWTT